MSTVNPPLSEGQEPLEIERKFLIRYPDLDWLSQQAGIRRAELVQTYLLSDGGVTRRVREWCENGQPQFYLTEKRALSDLSRVKIERAVSRGEYLSLLQQGDPARRSLRKTRWMLPCGSHCLEIDLYPFWTDRAILEIELRSETEEYFIPPQLHVIREVTGDARYLNSSLARNIVYE